MAFGGFLNIFREHVKIGNYSVGYLNKEVADEPPGSKETNEQPNPGSEGLGDGHASVIDGHNASDTGPAVTAPDDITGEPHQDDHPTG